MAKRQVTIVVCDACGADAPDASTWTIRSDQGTVRLELCKKDARPLTELVGKGRARKPRKSTQVFSSVDDVKAAFTPAPTQD